ncbi:MAG: dihydrolipoamide acetyltransferase family protein [Betaproteobacteria bacterium]|jgi:pyruvate dehydrogenase E2 component (dihydrolipoamide acetyltransferase)
MSEFRMPSLGADMQYGTVVEWRVKPGDAVKRGDVVALVETEKGVIEVEIFESGVIESLVIQPGQKVPVGTTLATLSGDGKKVAQQVKPASIAVAPVMPASLQEKEPSTKASIAAAPVETTRLRISPLARKRAQELSVDLSHVTGAGAEHSITVADVERAAEAAQPPAASPIFAPTVAAKGLDLAGMRRVIAAAMARSKREIPHYYLSTTIDMRRSLDWLAAENGKRPVTKRLLYSVLLIRAVALALRSTPELNGFWIDEAFKPGEGIHVGVAISLRQGGLVNPAIHDVDRKSLDELMESMLDLVNRARSGHLRSSELSDGTITVTNLGEQGVESVFGVIYPPQVALVGFGRIAERPYALNGMVGVRPVIEATLAADHRVSDGHRGGRFLLEIEKLLQDPEKL